MRGAHFLVSLVGLGLLVGCAAPKTAGRSPAGIPDGTARPEQIVERFIHSMLASDADGLAASVAYPLVMDGVSECILDDRQLAEILGEGQEFGPQVRILDIIALSPGQALPAEVEALEWAEMIHDSIDVLPNARWGCDLGDGSTTEVGPGEDERYFLARVALEDEEGGGIVRVARIDGSWRVTGIDN